MWCGVVWYSAAGAFEPQEVTWRCPPLGAFPDFGQRRRIRICCDELNLLVPFCNAETDKATTLQWTTAFLKYIQERHGDALKKVSATPRAWGSGVHSVLVPHTGCPDRLGPG